MLKLRLGATLALAGMTLLVGCHHAQVRQAQERPAQVAYDPAIGTETLVHNGIIYQTVGAPMEGHESDLVAVGTSEGFVLYQLPGGGGGGAGRNLLFIRTIDGRFQALHPIGTVPMQRQPQRQPNEGMNEPKPHEMPD